MNEIYLLPFRHDFDPKQACSKGISIGQRSTQPGSANGTHTNPSEGICNGLNMQIKARNLTKDGIKDRPFEFIWRRESRDGSLGAFIKALTNV